MAIEFITMRDLNPGKVKIIKLKEDNKATVEYICPSCSFAEKREEEYAEPFVTGAKSNKKFYVRCTKCGFEIKILKLKKQMSKDKKKKKGKE